MAALLMIVVVLVLRSAHYADPLAGLDEQFYVLVGTRMLDGAVPYVDIFDRKPFGLFALFAGLAALGSDPLLVAKLAATVFAAATALVVTAVAARWVRTWPAILAGCAYLAVIGVLGGASNQAPVFYNLLTALAVLLVLGTGPRLDRRGDRVRALGAMLCCGLAIQMKTMAAFEGAAIGLWLVVRLARVASPRTVAGGIVVLALVGLAPTLLVAGGFWLGGHGTAWWFANVESQLLKTGGFGADSLGRFWPMVARATPILAVALIGWLRMPRGEGRVLLAAWGMAGIAQAFAIGNFHPHYVLPLIVPAAIATAGVFAKPKVGPAAFAVLVAHPAWGQIVEERQRAVVAQVAYERVVAVLPIEAPRQCMLIYGAPMVYYAASRACLVTPYVFIDQLGAANEAGALPTPAGTAMRAAMARRPGTILTIAHLDWVERNRANDAMMMTALRHGYRPVARIANGWGTEGSPPLVVWRRSDLR